MRRVLGFALFATLVGATPLTARAATLPFTATLTVTFGTLPPIVLSASGTAISNGGGAMFTLPSGLFSTIVTFTPPSATILEPSKVRVYLSSNGGGVFNPSFSPPVAHSPTVALLGLNLTLPASPPGTGVGGPMMLYGKATIYALGLPTPLLKLGFSVGGTTATQMATNAGVVATILPTLWSTGYGVAIWSTMGGFPTPSGFFVITGSDARTPGGAGMITLVTPVVALVSLGGSPSNVGIPITLSVNFIPEPGTALLVGAGIAGLALAGRRRRRRA